MHIPVRLLMDTVKVEELTPSPAVCKDPLSKSNKRGLQFIGHIETDPSTSSYFVTRSQVVGSMFCLFV